MFCSSAAVTDIRVIALMWSFGSCIFMDSGLRLADVNESSDVVNNVWNYVRIIEGYLTDAERLYRVRYICQWSWGVTTKGAKVLRVSPRTIASILCLCLCLWSWLLAIEKPKWFMGAHVRNEIRLELGRHGKFWAKVQTDSSNSHHLLHVQIV